MKRIKSLILCFLIFILLIPNSVFAASPSTTYNFYFKEVVNTSGQFIDEIKIGTSKISEGTSGSKAEKWFLNAIQGKLLYNGTYQNVEYNFNGQFLDENGEVVTFPIKSTYIEGVPQVNIYLYPQYDLTPLSFLEFNYIDNISTGSGSWANKGNIISYTHTFKQPEDQEGYQFITWRDYEEEKDYAPGETYTCDITQIPAGETKEVNIYAVWQPSLIVNWYDEENLIYSEETFEQEIKAYSLNPEQKEGMDFIEWIDEAGEQIDSETVYTVPDITIDKVEQKTINLYSKYEIIPTPEPTITPTVTPEPTVTPKPTITPKPTVTPTITPKPTITPEPTKIPTVTPKPTITPKPPQPTVTPVPTKIPTPVPTIEPIVTTEPTPVPTTVPINPEPTIQPTTTPDPIVTYVPVEPTIRPEDREDYGDVLIVTQTAEKESKPTRTFKPVTTITPTPIASIEIEEDDVPLTLPVVEKKTAKYWALINLFLLIISICVSVILIFFFVLFKQKKEEQKQDNNQEEKQKIKKHTLRNIIICIASIVISCILFILFIFTEDMRLPMGLIDRYTLGMLIMTIIQLFILFFFRRNQEKEDEEDE